jgi:hypothetical protein
MSLEAATWFQRKSIWRSRRWMWQAICAVAQAHGAEAEATVIAVGRIKE